MLVVTFAGQLSLREAPAMAMRRTRPFAQCGLLLGLCIRQPGAYAYYVLVCGFYSQSAGGLFVEHGCAHVIRPLFFPFCTRMIRHITWFIEGPPVGSRPAALGCKGRSPRRRKSGAGREEEQKKNKTGTAPKVGSEKKDPDPLLHMFNLQVRCLPMIA